MPNCNKCFVENDLNLEIDRLTQLSAEQKRRIAELEFNQCGGEIGDHNIAVSHYL